MQRTFDVLADERVLHDRRLVGAQYLLEGGDVVVLVSLHQIGHRDDLRVVLVGLRLLRVEWIDVRLHEHRRQHQVLEAGGAPRVARLVVVLERLEEVDVRLFEGALAQVHLAAAFCNRRIDHTHTSAHRESRP